MTKINQVSHEKIRKLLNNNLKQNKMKRFSKIQFDEIDFYSDVEYSTGNGFPSDFKINVKANKRNYKDYTIESLRILYYEAFDWLCVYQDNLEGAKEIKDKIDTKIWSGVVRSQKTLINNLKKYLNERKENTYKL